MIAVREQLELVEEGGSAGEFWSGEGRWVWMGLFRWNFRLLCMDIGRVYTGKWMKCNLFVGFM